LFPIFGKKVIVLKYGIYSVLGLTYLGLALGSLPGLRMNRATIALVGSAFLIALDVVTLQEAWEAIDAKTIVFLQEYRSDFLSHAEPLQAQRKKTEVKIPIKKEWEEAYHSLSNSHSFICR
jgi:hypothetical protein